MSRLISTTAALALLLVTSSSTNAQSIQLRTTRQTGRTGIAININLNRGRLLQQTSGFFPGGVVHQGHRHPTVIVQPTHRHLGVIVQPTHRHHGIVTPIRQTTPVFVPPFSGHHHLRRVQLADGTFIFIR